MGVLRAAGLGVGQTWQNVVGSRAQSTTYYNTTGRPIVVIVALGYTSNGGTAMTVDGVSMGMQSVAGATGSFKTMGVAVVKPGGSYSAVGGTTLDGWWELS